MRAKTGTRKRWKENKGYRDMHHKRVREGNRKRFCVDEAYHLKNNLCTTIKRIRNVCTNQQYKDR